MLLGEASVSAGACSSSVAIVGLCGSSAVFCEACERLLAVRDLVAWGDRWRGRGVIASSNVSYAVERCSLVPIDKWPRSCICADLIRTVSSESGLLPSSLVGVVGLSAMVFQLTFSWCLFGIDQRCEVMRGEW